MQGMRIRSMVRALSSHMPRGQKISNRSNIATDSIKTLKWSTLKKKKKLCLSEGGELLLGKPALHPSQIPDLELGALHVPAWPMDVLSQGASSIEGAWVPLMSASQEAWGPGLLLAQPPTPSPGHGATLDMTAVTLTLVKATQPCGATMCFNKASKRRWQKVWPAETGLLPSC